jgi:hypothetical protein
MAKAKKTSPDELLAELAGQEVDKLLADGGMDGEEGAGKAVKEDQGGETGAAETLVMPETASAVEATMAAGSAMAAAEASGELSKAGMDALLSSAAEGALADPGAGLAESLGTPESLGEEGTADEETLAALATADVATAEGAAEGLGDAPADGATAVVDESRTSAAGDPEPQLAEGDESAGEAGPADAGHVESTAELDALFAALTETEQKDLAEGTREEAESLIKDFFPEPKEPAAEVPGEAAPEVSAEEVEPTESGGGTGAVTESAADPARAALLAIENQPQGPSVSMGERLMGVLAWINGPFDRLGDTARTVAGAFGVGSLLIGLPAIIWRVWFYKG